MSERITQRNIKGRHIRGRLIVPKAQESTLTPITIRPELQYSPNSLYADVYDFRSLCDFYGHFYPVIPYTYAFIGVLSGLVILVVKKTAGGFA